MWIVESKRRGSRRVRRGSALGAAAALMLLGVSPEAVAGPPPDHPVDTPHEHAAEDHVIHDAAAEERLQASTRRQTADHARAAKESVSAAPADSGVWGPVTDWPVVGVHVALLSNGKVLAYDSVGDQATERYTVHDHTRATVFDPTTGTQSRVDVNTGYNIFCSGLSHLPDGKVFLAGGNKDQFLNGIVQTHLFEAAGTWTRGPDMAAGRWYPTVTSLHNGEQLITSGGPPVPEVYQGDGTLRKLNTATLSQPLYPWMVVAPKGPVVDTGPGDTLRSLNPASTGAWRLFGGRDGIDRNYGGHVLYDIGKILVAGGGHTTSSARVVDVNGVDFNSGAPTVSSTSSMAFPRRQHNLTVLADGTVLATGGLKSSASLVDLNAGVYNAERWDPATGQWTTLAAESVTRQYHSSALLLPDGRVLSSGGGICGTCDNVGYLAKNAQIFSPPYLFDAAGQPAARPTITSAPSAVGYGSSFTVETLNAGTISKTALVRLGSVTHSNNMEQRYVPVPFTAGSSSLQVTAPANANLAPPGVYMLFLVNSAGVPSVASMVEVGAATAPPPPPPTDLPPTVQLTAPADLSSFAFKSTVTLEATASDDRAVSKVEFFSGTTKLGEDTTGPYSFVWRSVPQGTYTVTARATDDTGHTTTSSAVRFTVRKKRG